MIDMFGRKLSGIEDVGKVFCNYISQQPNELGVKVRKVILC